MPNIGPMELVVILVIALVVLGPKKLPEVGRSVGKGMREFKESLTGENETQDEERPVLRSKTDAEDRRRLGRRPHSLDSRHAALHRAA